MSVARRLAEGGRIDRSRPLGFSFDGTSYEGCAGDTLASALLANGVDVIGSSVAYGRPRGVYAAGAEEPNAFVQLAGGAGSEPMLRATEIELYDGLSASSLAGRGRLSGEPDPAIYDKMCGHCDVLVVGGGPAGLAAALAAGRTGARVVLVDEGPELGGSLLGAREEIDGAPASQWVAEVAAAARRRPGGAGARAHHRGRLLRPQLRRARGAADRLTSVPARRGASPASASGTCGQDASCSPPARTSGRSCSPTTTARGSCWPARRGRT